MQECSLAQIMKLGVGLLSLMLLVALVWIAIASSQDERLPAATSVASPGPEVAAPRADRFAELEDRILELEAELDDLKLERSGPSVEVRTPVASEPEAAPVEPEPEEQDKSPAWYLEQYVASFRTRDSGSEYFRLAVEAYAPTLFPRIASLVRDFRSHPVLRVRLVEILGDSRFAGDDQVVDTLIRVMVSAEAETLAKAALGSLREVADARTAPLLERSVWAIPWKSIQLEALRLIVSLAGPDANASILRLLGSGVDDSIRAFLVTLLNQDDLASALGVFRLIVGYNQPVRLQGAHKIGEYRHADFVAFVEHWISIEPDAEVRAVLGEARERQSQVPRWNALQAVGPPDADPAQDNPRAWAARQAEMGEQWLNLTYEAPLRAHTVRIFEVNVAGAVTKLVATDENGRTHALWSGSDPTEEPGVFEISFPTTSYRIRSLRIHLDTNRRSGWDEIDAVELVGPDGAAWASHASASSNYGT